MIAAVNMSFITDIARTVLGNNTYKYVLSNVYGIGNGVNIMQELHRNMLIWALDLNDTTNYYSQEQLDCLNVKIHRGGKQPKDMTTYSATSGINNTR